LALKSLDVNKDGVIDLQEFSWWYFTGMKSLTGTQKTLLRLGGHSKNLLDLIGEKAKLALMSDKLVTKNHSMSIGFDAP